MLPANSSEVVGAYSEDSDVQHLDFVFRRMHIYSASFYENRFRGIPRRDNREFFRDFPG